MLEISENQEGEGLAIEALGQGTAATRMASLETANPDTAELKRTTSGSPDLRVAYHAWQPDKPGGFFELLRDVAKLSEPPLLRSRDTGAGSPQIEYIEDYVTSLGCRSVAIEPSYIDRDYMEDYTAFYSRSFYPYPNSCHRIHFFALDYDSVPVELEALLDYGRRNDVLQGNEAAKVYSRRCQEWSRKHYLGFCVIRPLGGCPVGRTVLRGHLPTNTNALSSVTSTAKSPDLPVAEQKCYACIRPYETHLLGVDLTVDGLAFQQQDVGVSACATTAIWSSLHKMRDFEEIGTPTPAQITGLASRDNLPFGRAMPSEGLSVDQMSQAIQSLGLSPNVIPIEEFQAGRGYLHSAALSGFAPVLILRGYDDPMRVHAVTLAGIAQNLSIREPLSLAGDSTRPPVILTSAYDEACGLETLYVHDDRIGPYVRAALRSFNANAEPLEGEPMDRKQPSQFMKLGLQCRDKMDWWILAQILIPMHDKIRVSFVGMRKIALHLVERLEEFQEVVMGMGPDTPGNDNSISFHTWIERGTAYTKRLLLGPDSISAGAFHRYSHSIHLARYIGIVRITGPQIGVLDVLVDTTSTSRNLHFLGVVGMKPSGERHLDLLRYLSEDCRCNYIPAS